MDIFVYDYKDGLDVMHGAENTFHAERTELFDTQGKIAGVLVSKSEGFKEHSLICLLHGTVCGYSDKTLEEFKKQLQDLCKDFLTTE